MHHFGLQTNNSLRSSVCEHSEAGLLVVFCVCICLDQSVMLPVICGCCGPAAVCSIRTSLNLQQQENFAHHARSDNEIRLQLPPSLSSSLTYLLCADAPVFREASSRGSSLPTNSSCDLQSKPVAGARRPQSQVSFFWYRSVVICRLPLLPHLPPLSCTAGPCGTCPRVIMSCDERGGDYEIPIMRPILENAPPLQIFTVLITIASAEGRRMTGNHTDSSHCADPDVSFLPLNNCQWMLLPAGSLPLQRFFLTRVEKSHK